MKKRNRKIKNIFSFITVSVFSLSLLCVCISFFVLPKSGYSIIEKRELTPFPKFSFSALFNGSYTDDITKYVSDNFVAREKLVEFSSFIEDKRGIRADGVKIYSDEGLNNKTLSIDTPLKRIKKTSLSDETPLLGEEIKKKIDFLANLQNAQELENLDSDEIKGQKAGPLFIIGDTALEIFSASPADAANYIDILNNYRKAIPSKVNVYNLITPNHFEFGLPKKYKSEVGRSQKDVIDEIYSSLDSSIITVDAYSNIKKHYQNGEYLYFRTDHHWTALGAYRAYEAFAQSAGFAPTPLEDFEKRLVEKFLGTFYSSTHDKNLENNPDFVEFYAPTNEHTVIHYKENGIDSYVGALAYKSVSNISFGYLVFMGGDIPISITETDANTGRSLLIFKESYGNAFVPFLTRNFDIIYVADIRTFPFNAVDYVTEKGITDVLFLNNTITSCSPPRIKNYLDLMTK